MFLNIFLPAVLWGLALVNMLMAAWRDSSSPWAWTALIAGLALASVPAFVEAANKLRRVEIEGKWHDTTSKKTRVLVYLVLFGGVASNTWNVVPPMPWWKTEEPPPPSPVAPPEPVAQVDGVSPYVPAGPERLAHVPPNVMDLITRSRRELVDKKLDVSKCGGNGKGDLACRGDYLLAVTDASGVIEYVTIYEGGEPSKPGYHVSLGGGGGRASGVNPDIVVKRPPGVTVLAVKTAVNWAGGPAWPVYVPYSAEINTPEVRAAGVAYLWEKMEVARGQLRQAKVKSQFFDELVVDVIPADHAFTLVLTENVTHPEPFVPGGNNVRRLELLNEALAQLGANQSKAWDYRASRVGARGKGQFMEKTYVSLCKAYGLTCPPHAEGTQDDILVMKLMQLHADDEWRGIKNRTWLRGQPMLMRLYLAAGYNGFYGHAAKAIRICGVTKWRESKATCVSPLKGETGPYLYKYEFIHGQHWEAAARDAVAAEVYPDATVETTPAAEVEIE